jgi:hypothetical protein
MAEAALKATEGNKSAAERLMGWRLCKLYYHLGLR